MCPETGLCWTCILLAASIPFIAFVFSYSVIGIINFVKNIKDHYEV